MYGSSDPVCPFFAFYSLSDMSEAISPDSLVVSISSTLCFLLLVFKGKGNSQFLRKMPFSISTVVLENFEIIFFFWYHCLKWT